MRKSLTTKNYRSRGKGREKRREKICCNISQHNINNWGMKTCSYFDVTYKYIRIIYVKTNI